MIVLAEKLNPYKEAERRIETIQGIITYIRRFRSVNGLKKRDHRLDFVILTDILEHHEFLAEDWHLVDHAVNAGLLGVCFEVLSCIDLDGHIITKEDILSDIPKRQ